MRDKENKNLKTKITIKNFLVKKSQQQSFPTNSVNIQTITTYKNSNKKLYSTKNMSALKYLNTPNSNSNNNYIINEDQISFSCYNSNQEPSPINSLNSSYSTYTEKQKNHKRHKKKYKNNNINTLDSINNLSLNSNIINTNNSVSSHSSNNSSYNECSDSSDISFQSRDYKRKNYYELMMAEENEIDYLSRKEVGLISSGEEDNNNSVDNNNSIEDNFSNEIERILIEIYNKNISIISSGEYNDNKNNFDIDDIEKQIKKYLKKQNFKTNLLVLKCLSNKIKELIGKYREKVFEIEEIKKIYEENKLKRQLIRNNNNTVAHSCNSVESNMATNSNSSYDSNNNNEEDLFYKNTLLLKVQDEMSGKGITNILLRELINIKKTLKISSKEIESIFKYPLSILRNDNGKKIKFSIELMQLEEFCKILLNDELISTLLLQMKLVFSQFKMPEIIQLIDQVQDESSHKNEMTRFDKYINDKLGINNTINEKNNNNNVISDTYETENDFTFNNNNNNTNNNSNNTNNNNKKNKILNKNNNEVENNNNNKKYDNNSGTDSVSNNSENNKCDFQDIDELLNYINEATDSKKGKKKNKRNKKNKKLNNKENIEISKNENVEKDTKYQDDNDFDIEFEQFKKDIQKDNTYFYQFNKISPHFSDEFLKKIGCI